MTFKRQSYFSKIKDGKLSHAISIKIKGMLGVLSNDDAVLITIEPFKAKRSLAQNRYYWGVVIQGIIDVFYEHGDSINKEAAHHYASADIGKLGDVAYSPDGKPFMYLKSTTDLSTADFEIYMEKIRAWAAGYGHKIPLPHEIIQDFDQKEEEECHDD